MKRVSLLSLAVCQGLVAALAAASCAPPVLEVPELPEVKELRDNCRVSPGLVHAAVWVCARNLNDVTVFGGSQSVGCAPAVRRVAEN